MSVPEEVIDVARGVAVDVARRYRGYVQHADLMQEAWAWALGNPGVVRRLMAIEDTRQRSGEIASAVSNRLRYWAEGEKAAACGYHPSDVAWYTEHDVAELLPSVFDPEAWRNPPQPERDGSSNRQDPAHGGNWLASLADVADAVARLDADTREILALRYQHEFTPREIAVHLGVADSTVHDRLGRAVGRVHRLLGGPRPEREPDEVGRRRAVSNARAVAETGRDFDGE